jgi:radical SAM protein with 4Fe4S-binding SPASM domain
VPAIRYPRLFEAIHELDRRYGMRIEIVGANHHVAYALSRGRPLRRRTAEGAAIPRRPIGLHAGKGLLYIDPDGAIHPSRELRTVCGQVSTDWLVEVYQRHPVFRALRDPNRFRGKCGLCEYRRVCGGNRARALAAGGSMLSDEPDCDHLPGLGAEVRAVG